MSNEKKAPEVLVLELVHSSRSQFVMDGVGGDDLNPDETPVIQFPSRRNIMTTSRVKVWSKEHEAFTHKTIRYIAGCPEIDPAKQEALGYKPNYLTDVISFIHGRLTVIKDGDDIGKFLFLKACSGNTMAENRPDNAIDIFKEIRTDIDAKDTEGVFDLTLRAMNYMGSLKSTEKDGATTYQEEQIGFLASLFKLPAFETGFKAEAWVALANKAQTDPVEFLNKIGAVKGQFQSDVAAGIAKGLITLDGRRAFFTEGNKFIMTFENDLNALDQQAALADHMGNPKSKTDYDHLKSLLNVKRNAEAGVVN